MKSQRVEFRPPKGSVPEGMTANEDFDLVCSFRVKDTGDVCLVKFGDAEMPGYDGKASEAPAKEEHADMAGKMMQAGPPAGGGY